MATFKSECGKIIIRDTRKMKLEEGGIFFKRVPKPKYKSRQARLDESLETLNAVVEDVQAVETDLGALETDDDDVIIKADDQIEFDNEKERILGIVDDLDLSDIGSIVEEMEEWRDNMEGTNLELTTKYDEVSECAGNLRDGFDNLEGLESPPDKEDLELFIENLSSYRNELESAVSELEGIYFPGMFG